MNACRPLGLACALAALLLGGCLRWNAAPTAEFSRTPSFGDAPLSVFFDAGASVDSDGTIVEYRWEFGDGVAALGPTATHTYVEGGTYESTLTVTDDRGEQGAAVRMIDVRVASVTPAVGLAVGDLAPDFTLPELSNGADVNLASFRGYVVLLDFWASQCTPCRTSMPHLEVLRKEFADQGLIVLAVNLDASEGTAREFVEEGGYGEFVVVRDAREAVKALYGVDGIPYTFVIDRQGVIRHADHPIRLRAWQIEPWL
ncbi:MAG: redoxin domain-containing protein [Candidatus Bipolaricaulis sp.]|nr:redoxin domain-containing protein [Candidatus Bipolaricaulis sp.]MDD5219229.1 redoxin domain-containing protein [Candidatus Bipolaricaulis sp.]MDD5646063.1 redoxin domain-containing protein [Candidatus Bipolaricaulis sp.]